MSPDELFTRDEALGGLPARRAATLLFLIESRAAHFEARSRLAAEEFPSERTAEERDLAFLEAFALGREPPLRPTIQDLERHASKWANLIPENARLRAAIAHLLGEKYTFTSRAVPGIRAALGLDEEAVQQAYQRLYGQPLSVIFAPRVTLANQLRWASAALAGWVDWLPPFWTVFVLTVTFSLSQTFLALPIAVTDVGPLVGVALLILFGGINVLTITYMAEAISRNGTIRYRSAFIGRLVSDYLGRAGSVILTLATFTRVFLTLLATYIGLSATMGHFTRVPPAAWAALLFFVGPYLLARKSVNFSISLVALLGAINIGLLIILSILAFSHVRLANLSYLNVPFLDPHSFDLSLLQRVFGVVLMAYIGSAYIMQCAKVVLPRDPSGRSLIWGSVAGTAAMTVLLCIWTLGVNGAVAPQVLTGLRATVLPALATEVGPSVNVFGSILVILLLGMAWIRQSSLLFALIRERLPARSRPVLMLPRRRGRLLFYLRGKPSGSPRIDVTYLGLKANQPHLRLDIQLDGNTHRVETTVAGRWEAGELLDRLPDLRKRGVHLELEVLDANQESVRLRIITLMGLAYEGEWDVSGLHMVDVFTLSDSVRHLVSWIMRQGEVGLAEAAAQTHQSEEAARTMLDTLVEQGFVRKMDTGGLPRYRPLLARKRGHQLPRHIWRALDEKVEVAPSAGGDSSRVDLPALARRARDIVLSERGRFLLSTGPELTVFLLTEWLLLTGTESFTGVIGFAGVIGNSLLSGIFPVLLLVSSRRKGEFVPGVVFRLLGHPFVITSIYLLFLGNLFLHGLVIWDHPLERAGALIVGLLVLGVTITMMRGGAFARRVVVELREELRVGGRAVFAVTVAGQPTPAEVQLQSSKGEQRCQAASGEVSSFSSLRSATFRLPAAQAKELKVWAHRVTPEGDSEGLPALVEIHSGSDISRFDLKLSGGQVVLPVTSGECWLRITLPEKDSL